MKTSKIKDITQNLNSILMQPFSFKGMKIELNYADRAKHTKNWTVATHYHPWFEFNYVSYGSFYTTLDGTEFLVTSGNSFLIPPGVSHSHRHNNSGDDGICIRFSLKSDEPSEIFDVLSFPHPMQFKSILSEIPFSGSIYSIQAQFSVWLMQIFDLQNTSTPKPKNTQNTFASQVILYLKEYYMQKITVTDIANAMNTSYRTLIRKFKAETNKSVIDTLTQIRLDKAKQLLISTKMPMYEIALQCGYENEFYFSKIFKQKLNCSPNIYRRKHFINI